MDLEFKWGYTRVVVLFGNRVYKIARFRVLRAVVRLILHVLHGQVKEKLQQVDARPERAIFKYLLCGVTANREEWYISRKYPDQERVEVLAMYAWGLMLVEERGSDLAPEQSPENHPLWQMMLRQKRQDIAAARAQFAVFGGVIKLIDLGRGDIDEGLFP